MEKKKLASVVTHKILHLTPKESAEDFVIIPYNIMQNKYLLRFRIGDMIEMETGDKYLITSVTKLSTSNRIVAYLCRLRYGVPMRVIRRAWQKQAERMGRAGTGDIVTSECLLITFEKQPIW